MCVVDTEGWPYPVALAVVAAWQGSGHGYYAVADRTASRETILRTSAVVRSVNLNPFVSNRRKSRQLIVHADRARGAQRWREAGELYAAALLRRPDDAATHIQCGHMFKEAGDYLAAETHYLQARILAPGDANLYLQLGHFYKVTGRLHESFSAYERAAELVPGWDEPQREMEAFRQSVRSGLQSNRVAPALQSSSDTATSQSADERAAELAPGWAEPQREREMEALRELVRSRLQSNTVAPTLRSSSDTATSQSGTERVSPPRLLHPGAHPRRVLWFGSSALASRRERERLAACGIDIIFREVVAPGADPGSAARFAKDRELSAAAHTSSSLRETALALRDQFACVVVENDVGTLAEQMRLFPGKIVFRSYGISRPLGEMLWDYGLYELAKLRPNLVYVPTVSQAISLEARLAPWLQQSAAALPGLHAVEEDLRDVQWCRPCNVPRPAGVVVPSAEDTHDNSRRHRAFIQEAFPASDSFRHIELPRTGEAGPGGAALDDTGLQALARTSVLLYTDQMPAFAILNSVHARAVGTAAVA
jgi:tetratricopeptide (TPR) repeat protein